MSKASKSSSIGSSLAATLGIVCPVCWPASAALLASAGLGFLVNLKIILPVLALFLIIAWFGMYKNYKENHHHVMPFVVSLISGIFIPLGKYVIMSLTISNIAIGLFIGAALWNNDLLKKCNESVVCKK